MTVDWDALERDMAPEWGRLAHRAPRDSTTYSWPVSIAIVAVYALILLAVGVLAGLFAL